MNTINKIFFGVALLALIVSCNPNKLPQFTESDNFVAFVNSKIMVKEDAGTLQIPVRLSSINPVQTNVTYSVVPRDGDAIAKEGVNFSLQDKSAVLAFDGKTRENFISVNILDVEGYTGDVSFMLRLGNGGKLGLGACDSCVVTIQDKDHPLIQLFGTYEGSADTVDDGKISWPITIGKVEGSIISVKIYNISPFYGTKFRPYPKFDNSFIANVAKDGDGNITGIMIPIGQEAPAECNFKGKSIIIGEYFPDIDDANFDGGNIIAEYDKDSKKFTINQGMIIYVSDTAPADLILPNTTTWTKKKE